MTKLEDDGVVVEIDPKQLNLTLDPETERKAKPKDEDVRAEPEETKPSGRDEAVLRLEPQLEQLREENSRIRAAYEQKAKEADEALAAARNASGHVAQSQYDLVNTNIANAKARAEAIKREIKIARETGDTDR